MQNGSLDYGNATSNLEPDKYTKMLSFERPCEKRLEGDLILEIVLLNGTHVRHSDFWKAYSCGPQNCQLDLHPEKAELRCTFG
jgi:hypothetical protein